MTHQGFINLDRYPIHSASAKLNHEIDEARRALAVDGCAVLRGFLTPAGVCALAAESDASAQYAHETFSRTNPYFTQDDTSLPKAHPQRRFFNRSNAFVPAVNFHKQGALRSIHDAPGFDDFVESCLQEDQFYRYGDPLADVIVNVANEGPGFPWHFDTNNFTVTLAIQNAEEGGEFEYAPGIRKDDENFEEEDDFDDIENIDLDSIVDESTATDD